jgi:hypothetical protein
MKVSLHTYSSKAPANGHVEYIEHHHFRAALLNRTEYMGYPTPDGNTDKLWSDLYNREFKLSRLLHQIPRRFSSYNIIDGISKISAEEAQKLSTPTLAIPGTTDYLVQLDVFHELHCLNDLRKAFYPDVHGGIEATRWPNGTINYDHEAYQHWEHCLDSLRQTIMCHADVAPIPFHVNVPANFGIFPRLATTHTCKNFTKIQEWAWEHQAGEWSFNVSKDEAQKIIEESGFDNSPEEDIQFLYGLFPGNKWFKFWREHSVDEVN